MTVNIFIDTSIFLNFYTASNDDLEQLEIIIDLIDDNSINLIVNKQIEREWLRNRDNKIATSIENLEKIKFKLPSIPRFMTHYGEIAEMRKALTSAENFRLKALKKAKEEAFIANTNADNLIRRIFLKAGVQSESDDIFSLAKRRLDIGDPRGKPASLGDRINWEYLLSQKTSGDLHIVSKDGDYFSALDEKTPKYALFMEWFAHKKGKLAVHRELKPFLASIFPQFKFRSKSKVHKKSAESPPVTSTVFDKYWENRKTVALMDLTSAIDFEQLAKALVEIEKIMPALSANDILQICRISINNEAVNRYAHDPDVSLFFEGIFPRVCHLLDKKEIEAFEMIFDIELHPEEYEIYDDDPASHYRQMDLDLLEQKADEEINYIENAGDRDQ